MRELECHSDVKMWGRYFLLVYGYPECVAPTLVPPQNPELRARTASRPNPIPILGKDCYPERVATSKSDALLFAAQLRRCGVRETRRVSLLVKF